MENRTFVDGITKYEVEARIAYNAAGDSTIYPRMLAINMLRWGSRKSYTESD